MCQTGPEDDIIFPTCEAMEVMYAETTPIIDLIGTNFTEEYEIWFDDVPITVIIHYLSQDSLRDNF